jgi:hypothetical protein
MICTARAVMIYHPEGMDDIPRFAWMICTARAVMIYHPGGMDDIQRCALMIYTARAVMIYHPEGMDDIPRFAWMKRRRANDEKQPPIRICRFPENRSRHAV